MEKVRVSPEATGKRLPVQRLHSSIAAIAKGDWMPSLASRDLNLDQESHLRRRQCRAFRGIVLTSMILFAGLAFGCSEASRGTNANSSASSNQKAASNANLDAGSGTAARSWAIDIQEPERYSVAMTISIQETSSETPTPMQTQQFDFAKLGADRRWAFVFPAPLGQVVYLEKSGLRYFVLFERKLYMELPPTALGFELSKVMTPNSIARRLNSHQFEKLGLEPVNGRTAIKYRATSASDASAHIIFVDQETGLPLRSELSAVAASGSKSRVIVEARDVRLNPDIAQFDVPIGMKKAAARDAAQQIEAFASALRLLADNISGTQSAPVASITQPANKNAARSGR